MLVGVIKALSVNCTLYAELLLIRPVSRRIRLLVLLAASRVAEALAEAQAVSKAAYAFTFAYYPQLNN